MSQQISIDEILPFTPCQRFFLGNEEDSENSIKNVQQYTYILDGKIDESTFRHAWQHVVDTYPGLRTTLHTHALSQPFQVIHTEAILNLYFNDIRQLGEKEQDVLLAQWKKKDAETPLDWKCPPLMRVALHRVTDTRSQLLVTLDHLIFDGWSLGLAIQGFLTTYATLQRGETVTLSTAPSVKDYALWQKEKDTAQAMAWYKRHMVGALPQPLPFAEPGAPSKDICAQDIYFLNFTAEEDRKITDGAKKCGVTVNTLFQGAWALMLSRCHEEGQAYFLTSISSRPLAVQNIERVFSLLLGIIPFVVECPEDIMTTEWLKGIQAYQVSSMEYDYAPPQEILALKDDLTPLPLTSWLLFQNMDTGETKDLQGEEALSLRAADTISRVGSALVIAAFPFPTLHLSLLYDRQIFKQESIKKIAELLRSSMLSLAESQGLSLRDVISRSQIDVALQDHASMPIHTHGA